MCRAGGDEDGHPSGQQALDAVVGQGGRRRGAKYSRHIQLGIVKLPHARGIQVLDQHLALAIDDHRRALCHRFEKDNAEALVR